MTTTLAPIEDKAVFQNAIVAWVDNKRSENALTAQEIGALPGFDRIDAMRKAELVNMTIYCRNNPRQDAMFAVYHLILMMADNESGVCKISQPIMAQIFGRKVRAIADAISRLKAAGFIDVNGASGHTANYEPIIDRSVACKNHRVWLVESLRATPVLENRGTPVLENSGYPCAEATTPVLKNMGTPVLKRTNPCAEEQGTPVLKGGPYFTKDFTKDSTKELTDAQARASKVEDGTGSTNKLFIAATALAGAITAGATGVPAITPDNPVSHIEAVGKNWDALRAMMTNCAGDALNRSAPALEVMVEPSRWFDMGFDFWLDILPTIADLSKKAGYGKIKSWNYFTSTIVENHRKRISLIKVGNKKPPRQDADSLDARVRAAIKRRIANGER